MINLTVSAKLIMAALTHVSTGQYFTTVIFSPVTLQDTERNSIKLCYMLESEPHLDSYRLWADPPKSGGQKLPILDSFSQLIGDYFRNETLLR